MSEDALARHIDERVALGDSAPEPTDGETRELAGTVRLVQSALGSPAPDESAERESCERVVSQLRETAAAQPPKSGGLIDRITGLFKRK